MLNEVQELDVEVHELQVRDLKVVDLQRPPASSGSLQEGVLEVVEVDEEIELDPRHLDLNVQVTHQS